MRRILFLCFCALFVGSLFAQNNSMQEKKVTIKDLFLMLPDEAFDEGDFSLSRRKEMLKTVGRKSNSEDDYTYIDICDPRNGYMSAFYYWPEEYKYEICYWNLKEGRKLIALNKSTGFGKLSFYLYENGKLRPNKSYAPDLESLRVEDFFDTSRLNKQERETLTDLFNNRVVFEFVLPRKGTSIEMSVGSIPYDMEYETMFQDAGLEDKISLKRVVFKWVNQKWIKEIQNAD